MSDKVKNTHKIQKIAAQSISSFAFFSVAWGWGGGGEGYDTVDLRGSCYS